MTVYAVRKGHTVGIFHNWTEVQVSIAKYKGSDYRKFDSTTEAEAWVKTLPWEEGEPGAYYAYVDGSNIGNERFSGAFLIVKDGEVIHEASAQGAHEVYREKRNIAGELLGTLIAMQWAYANNVRTLYVCHDYVGIAKWATGDFKARDELSIAYKGAIDTYESHGMEFRFIKLEGHTGHEYNERVDALAKAELRLKK